MRTERPRRGSRTSGARSGAAHGSAALDRLLFRLHEAQTIAEVQTAYLGAIDDVIRARAHGIYRLDPATGRLVDVVARAPDGFLDDYERNGRAGDPVLHRAVACGGPVDNTRILSEPEWQRTPVYQVLRRARFTHSMEAPVLLGGAVVGTLNLARGLSDPPFAEEDLALLGAISRHVAVALRRAQRFEALERRAALLEDALDALPQPVLISRLDGGTLFANRAAERLVLSGEPRQAAACRRAVRANLRALAEGSARVALAAGVVADGVGAAGRAGGQPADGFLVRSVLLPRRHGAVLSFVYLRPSTSRLPVEWSPLSPREQEIVELVSRGLSTREIAERACISENTVKQHLKRVFRKLQVSSRTELVQTVWQVGSAVQGAPG